MSSSSTRRPFRWHCALAVAVIAGAGGAFAFAATQGPAPERSVRAEAVTGPLTTSSHVPARPSSAPRPTTPAAPPLVLPFNAKLTSHDIPVLGGGVRTGGCSGALVAADWVVTAGHCFHDLDGVRVGGKPAYDDVVTVGKNKDSDPGGQTAHVIDVRQSPLNDLALAKLSNPITGIQPLALADQPPSRGQDMQFAGWGSLSSTVVEQSDHLKRGRFEISAVTSSTIEAVPLVPRTVENSPCKDDSGGPYFTSSDDVSGTLIAVENTGPSCPQPGTEILARVDVLHSWIEQQISG